MVIKEKILGEAVPKYLSVPSKNKNTGVSKKPSPPVKDFKPVQLSKPHPSGGGVDLLAQKTSHLNITAAATDHTMSKSVEPQAKSMLARKQQFSRATFMETDSCEVRRSPRLMAKRVRSVADEVRFQNTFTERCFYGSLL